MKYKCKGLIFVAIFILLTGCLLCRPQTALIYSLEALNLWFQKMIPALLPFMILSGILIRLGLSDRFAALFSPVLGPVFRIGPSCLYVIAIGFLCGFPMGARVCAESLSRKKISTAEAQFLLSFCNNIGPVYITGYVMSLFPVKSKIAVIAGIYGIPLLYGLFLRYTRYQNINYKTASSDIPDKANIPLSWAVNQSVITALDSITVLGGYMILCNLLNILPALFITNDIIRQFIGGLLEITSGLSRMKSIPFFISYSLLCFGGLSCIAQTSSCIHGSGLSLKRYFYDKLIQSLLSLLYFGLLL